MERYKVKYERYSEDSGLIDTREFTMEGTSDKKIQREAEFAIPLRESWNKKVVSMKIVGLSRLELGEE